MKTSNLLIFAALIGPFFTLLFCLVAPGIHGPMYLDSSGRIEANAHIFEQAGVAGVVAIFPQRPIPMASFFLNYYIAGMDRFTFRIVNLLLHSIAATLVVLLMRMVLDLPGPAHGLSNADKQILSLFMGVFFLIHPLQIFVTLYIWQRMAIFAYLFCLASLLCYLSVRMRFIAPWAGYILTCLFFLLGLLSKENAVTLGLVLLLFDASFFSKDLKSLAKRSAVIAAILLAIVGLVSLLQHAHGLSSMTSSGILTTIKQYYKESGLSSWEVLLTQCRVIFQYISMVILPVPSSVHLIQPQVISSSLVSPPITAVAVAGIAALILLGIGLLFVRPLSGIGILFFIINMVPDSLLVPQFAFFGYRPLFGIVGICLVAVDCLAMVLQSVRSPVVGKYLRIALIVLGLGYCTFLGVVTSKMASIWDVKSLFYRRAVEAIPKAESGLEKGTASLVLFGLGSTLKDEGRLSEAGDYMHRALKMRPGHPIILTGLASLSRRMGKIPEAEKYLESAILCPVPFPGAYRDLGLLKLDLGKVDEAIRCLEKARTIAPLDPVAADALQRARNRKGSSSKVKP